MWQSGKTGREWIKYLEEARSAWVISELNIHLYPVSMGTQAGWGTGGRGYSGFLFLGRKIWQVVFQGIQNNLKIRGSARVSRPRSSANKVQPNLFCGCFNIGCLGCLECC